MNILHVIAGLSPEGGGPHKVAPELCRALAREGQAISLYTTNASRDGVLNVATDRPITVDGVNIHYFPIGRWRRWGFSRALGEAIRDNVANFDVVHIHSLYLFHTSITAHYCRRYAVPYLIRPHGTLDPFLRRKSRFKKAIYNFLLEKRNLDRAAAIHYTTEEEMQLAHQPLKIQAPAVVVPLGLDLHEYAVLPPRGTLRARFPKMEDKFLILFLGRINFKKGLDLLAHAYGQIARQRDNVHLVIVGPDNEGYGRQVRAWLAKEGAVDKVTFTGMLLGKDKLAAFRDSDLFVLPSYTENFGLAVVEAMACRLPVVISNKVNIWRDISEGEAGLVINCDAQELAQALLQMIENHERRKQLGCNGKRLVKSKFTWDKVAAEMIRVYQDILDKHRNRNEN